MKKPKKYWISRDMRDSCIEVWTVKPVFNDTRGAFLLPIRCKKSIHEYLLKKFHYSDFQILFGKILSEGQCCQASFNMEVYL